MTANSFKLLMVSLVAEIAVSVWSLRGHPSTQSVDEQGLIWIVDFPNDLRLIGGEVVNLRARVLNTAGAPVEILIGQVGCSCTEVALGRSALGVGEETEIQVTVDSRTVADSIESRVPIHVSVVGDMGRRGTLVLPVYGRVDRTLGFPVSFMDLGTVNAGEGKSVVTDFGLKLPVGWAIIRSTVSDSLGGIPRLEKSGEPEVAGKEVLRTVVDVGAASAKDSNDFVVIVECVLADQRGNERRVGAMAKGELVGGWFVTPTSILLTSKSLSATVVVGTPSGESTILSASTTDSAHFEVRVGEGGVLGSVIVSQKQGEYGDRLTSSLVLKIKDESSQEVRTLSVPILVP